MTNIALNIKQIMKQLPHRYPFLLVDRVNDCVPGKSLTAQKNVTVNEPFFSGHFPIRPVMPGVLIIEALAQATGLLEFATQEGKQDNDAIYFFVGIDKARFKRPVEPGDQLILKVKLLRRVKILWKFEAQAEVDGKIVAKAEIMCAPGKAES